MKLCRRRMGCSRWWRRLMVGVMIDRLLLLEYDVGVLSVRRGRWTGIDFHTVARIGRIRRTARGTVMRMSLRGGVSLPGQTRAHRLPTQRRPAPPSSSHMRLFLRHAFIPRIFLVVFVLSHPTERSDPPCPTCRILVGEIERGASFVRGLVIL